MAGWRRPLEGGVEGVNRIGVDSKPDPTPQPEAKKPATEPVSATVAEVAKPADNTLPATGDNGALAITLGVAGAAAAAAAAGVAVARRRSR